MARRNDEANLGSRPNKNKNMNTVLPIDKRNAVLSQMAVLLEKKEQPYKQKISKISPTIPVVI
jgi:hypothetical protein